MKRIVLVVLVAAELFVLLCACGGAQEAPAPPAAEPFTPIVGPPEGWRMAAEARLLRRPRPCTRPMVVVDLPSPRGVGVMAVTSTYLPLGLSPRRSSTAR